MEHRYDRVGGVDPYSQFQEPAEGGDMAKLQELARAQLAAQTEVERKEEELRQAKKLLADIAEKELPELMEKLRLTEFKTDDGLPIKIETHIRVGIPKAREGEAFAWVRSIGSGKMIKRKVSVPFAMGEDQLAEQFLARISDLELEYEEKTEIHPSTLKAFVRRRMEAGEEVHESINVHEQKVSKIG